MKNTFLFVCLLLSSFSLIAQQQDKLDLSAEIDKQVWEPFSEAYANYDAEKFIALHTDDVLRVTKWTGIRVGDDFKEGVRSSYSKPDRPAKTLEFEFEERIHSKDMAYEVGYYKTVRTGKDGNKKEYYGQFHVVLKKVDGVWKIAQDYDTGNLKGDPITAAEYDRLKKSKLQKKAPEVDFDKKYGDKVKTIDSTLKTLYAVISGEKGEQRDWDLFRYLFKEDAKLIPSGKNKAGQVYCRFMSPDDYVQSSGNWLVENGFFEKEVSRKVDTFGNITQVFSTYESFHSEADEKPFMRGINSIQLLNDGERWWVVNIYWMGESKDNPIPAKYLENNKKQ